MHAQQLFAQVQPCPLHGALVRTCSAGCWATGCAASAGPLYGLQPTGVLVCFVQLLPIVNTAQRLGGGCAINEHCNVLGFGGTCWFLHRITTATVCQFKHATTHAVGSVLLLQQTMACVGIPKSWLVCGSCSNMQVSWHGKGKWQVHLLL